LQKQNSFGVFRLSLLIFVISISCLEFTFRQPPILNNLPPSNLGSPYLNEPLSRLDLFSREYGKPNCLFLGSSMVYNGINPQIIETRLNVQSPNHFQCYTLGLGSLSAPTAVIMVELLIQLYHPQILIYGTSLRDYHSYWYEDKQLAIAHNPWVRFHQHQFSLMGGVIEYSYFYRQLMNLPYIIKADFQILGKPAEKNIRGYIPSDTQRIDVRQSVSEEFEIDAYTIRAYQSLGQLSPTALESIPHILALSTAQTQVILLEMPIHPTYLDYVANGTRLYEEWIGYIATQSALYDAPFIQAPTAVLLAAPTYWNDRSHLNIEGSTVFSTWLGDELAPMVRVQ